MKKQLNRKRIFDIIQIGQEKDIASRVFDIFIVINILLNITLMFMQTFDELSGWKNTMHSLELLTVVIFVIEYALRIWTADYLFPDSGPGRARLRFLCSFDGIVDLLTILPFFFLSGFVAFRMLRVVRIFHLFRINNTTDSFNVIKSVLLEKRNQILSSVFIIIILMLASSLFMYSAEHEAQPENFRNAFSGIWWSMSTLLTVGYGDIYPITLAGKIMAIVIAFLGVGVVAIPTGIISAGFVQQYTSAEKGNRALGLKLETALIGIDSMWIGLSTDELTEKYGCVVILVRRKNRTEKPAPDYNVELGDTIVFYRK